MTKYRIKILFFYISAIKARQCYYEVLINLNCTIECNLVIFFLHISVYINYSSHSMVNLLL